MSDTYTWDTSAPAGSIPPSQMDDAVRLVKSTLQTFFAQNFNFPATGKPLPGIWPILIDVYSNRPAFGTSGLLFWASDTFVLYVDTGAAWVQVNPSGWSEVVLFENWELATSNKIVSANYATLPYGVSWATGEGVLLDTTKYPASAVYSLRITANMGHAASFQLYDATASAAVAGSEIVGAVTGLASLRSSAPFTLTSGSHKLRVQAKLASTGATDYLFHASLEVTW